MGGLTPLLDTLFLLLFSLLAVSETRTEESRIEESRVEEEVLIEMPSVESGGQESAGAVPGDSIYILIDAESQVTVEGVDGVIPTAGDLDRELGVLLADRVPEELAVEIRSDRNAKHGVAVALLQQLRLRGFVNILLIASGDSEPDQPFGGGSQ